MSKYTYIHKDDHNGSKHYVSIESVTCPDIVRAFVSFLMACTFNKQTIINGFREVLEEMENDN